MTWRIGEILIQKKLITWDQLSDALEEQKRTKELTGEILVRKGYISRPLLYKALAEQHEVRFVDLKRTKINPKAVEKIPGSIAQKYKLMPIEMVNGELILGISNPMLVWPEAEIKQITQVAGIRTVLCLPEDVDEAIVRTYGGS